MAKTLLRGIRVASTDELKRASIDT